jgi:hypothetical protein
MAANIGTAISAWSTTAGSNQPDSPDLASTLREDLQAIQAAVRYLRTSGTIASAGTTDLATKSEEIISVSGTTTITALGTVSAGIIKYLVFEGALAFTHSATSLILPSAANITTAAGDTACMLSLGAGNWRCIAYQRASGYQVSPALEKVSSQSVTNASTVTFTGLLATSFNRYLLSGTFSISQDSALYWRIGTSSGIETGNNYSSVVHSIAATNGAPTSAITSNLNSSFSYIFPSTEVTAQINTLSLEFFNLGTQCRTTGNNLVIDAFGNFCQQNSGGFFGYTAGTIDRIQLLTGGGTITGTFHLYTLK